MLVQKTYKITQQILIVTARPIQISCSPTAMDKQNHLQCMALTWPQKLLT